MDPTRPTPVRRLDACPLVAEPDNELVLRTVLTADDSDADLSVTWVQLAGRHRALRTRASTRLYVVLAGTGTVTLDGHAWPVAAGDLVTIPAGAPYALEGPMTYLVVNQPAFRAGDDEYLEDRPGGPERRTEES